jgi:hypothetical protein
MNNEAVANAEKIILSGCFDYVDFIRQSAGLGLHPDDLYEIWQEFWADKNYEQEENHAIEQHYAI